ncbi:hypothetical protein BGZ80_010396 [Entomortierella chlamydospora]|uniref:Oligopeptide transporter n=1 Tax=Entomortierella chlamydospora TaxID=101097 RepID=A0A9P6T416_9FUNG|nr:hypothetical protein BGZ80_010396 [Entomortierella chlamydospora]
MTEEQDVDDTKFSLEEKGLAVTHYDLLTEHEKELLELEARINAELDAKIAANPTKMPKAIYFILPNEFGERFCYYAVQPNLNKYFILVTGMNAADAKQFSTAFTMWTIITFSCIYVIGMVMITIFAIPNLLGPVGTVSHFLTFLPMLIIAAGTGGVKPCVSAHGGDQYLASQEAGKDFFFNIFYVAINSGALITRYVVPEISKRGCYGQSTCFAGAFLLPTIVFILALADPNHSYVQSAQFSIINTILLVIFIPILPFFYQFCTRRGWNFGPGRRLCFGFLCLIIGFIISAILSPKIQAAYDSSPYGSIEPAKRDGMYCAECYSGWWQFPQWFFLSFGEAFFAPTGVQFMYIESGRQFRAIAVSFWMLAISFGSILILIFDPVFDDADLSTGTKNWAYSGLGFFGFILCVISMYFYTPRKIRPSINESARVAKEAEYALFQ